MTKRDVILPTDSIFLSADMVVSLNTKRKSASDEEDDDYMAAALAELHARGTAFLQSVGLKPTDIPMERIKKRRIIVGEQPGKSSEHHEWEGVENPEESTNLDNEDGQPSSFLPQINSRTQKTSKRKSPSPVIVFANTYTQRSPDESSKSLSKSFMSSKVSKIHVNQDDSAKHKDQGNEGDQGDDDVSHTINDKELHKLIHTRVLLGSQNSELKLNSAQRRKATEGRVLELASAVKLGEGDKAIRQAEKNRAAKHIRDGMKFKQMERDEKRLEEAKNMGNYHPVFKKAFSASSSGKSTKAKRDRGLKMGVGKFAGGQLKLSKQEIAQATGTSAHPKRRSNRR